MIWRFGSSLTLICLALATPVAAQRPTRPPNATFVCENFNGVPTTVARTLDGRRIPVIRWTSHRAAEVGYPPQKRCQIVSARFQQYNLNGSLRYLTTGWINGERAICTTDRLNGSCRNLLITLAPNSNPRETLINLLNIRDRARGPINETGDRLYVDFEQLLLGETQAVNGH